MFLYTIAFRTSLILWGSYAIVLDLASLATVTMIGFFYVRYDLMYFSPFFLLTGRIPVLMTIRNDSNEWRRTTFLKKTTYTEKATSTEEITSTEDTDTKEVYCGIESFKAEQHLPRFVYLAEFYIEVS